MIAAIDGLFQYLGKGAGLHYILAPSSGELAPEALVRLGDLRMSLFNK